MAKKAELLEKAAELNIEVNAKATIAELEAAIQLALVSNDKVEITEVVSTDEVATEEAAEPKLAKAGKRSAKAIAEAEAKEEKEARKEAGDTSSADGDEEASMPKGPKPVTRPLIERRGKNYRKVAEKVEATKLYTMADAIALAVETNPSKFDATVEFHVKLGVDPRQADQNIRATVSLPHGTGKTIKVAVFAPEADHKAAKAAGADIVGDETFLAQLDKDILDFDILIATPQFMPRLGKYARSLGPRGLMPNPKSGSVATDVAKAVTEAKAGKVEYRVDKQAIVHLGVGKVSFGAEKIAENARNFFDSLNSQKPTSIKGSYIRSISVSTTMGPAIKVENIA